MADRKRTATSQAMGWDLYPVLSLGRADHDWARELLDQLSGRLECIVAMKTFRDAAATPSSALVAHQAVGAASTIWRADFPASRLE